MPLPILNALDRAGENLTIVLAYIEYDVKDKLTDADWSHPCILFALAEIKKIELHLWQETSQGGLMPHPYYAQHIPAQAIQRNDLLFVNGNHFESLELVDGSELTHDASNTNAFKPF